MKNFIWLVLTSAALASTADAASKNLPADVLRFRYETYDKEKTLRCKHQLSSALSPYDWDVKCYDETGRLQKTFDVHLALSIYERTSTPRTSIELLYWISGLGATTWFHFNEKSVPASISSGQSVENGAAGLYLEVKLGTR